MPGAGDEGAFSFGAHGAEEVDGLMMGIGQPHWYDDMSRAHVDGRMYQPGDVELLQHHFAPFFYLGFVFTVFGILQLHGRSCTPRFKLNLGTQYPLAVELIVQSQNETWYADGVAVGFGVAVCASVEAVDAIVLEGCHGLAIATNAELGIFFRLVLSLCCRGCNQQSCGHNLCHFFHCVIFLLHYAILTGAKLLPSVGCDNT